jgi:hypothetical protein
MNPRRVLIAVVCASVIALPLIGRAQKGQGNQKPVVVTDETVNFGVTPPTTPILNNPNCATVGIGGPADKCAYRLHHLTPEESTIRKGGQLTLQVNGGGHAPAVYRVSKDTTRDELGQFLCAGNDPEHIDDPLNHPCDLSVTNSTAQHIIKDGEGDVVIVADANPGNQNVPPLNRVWSEPGRLTSVGGHNFVAADTLVTYRFLKTGRYLVICMNRTHFLNDWMFGFVNVVGDGNDDDR